MCILASSIAITRYSPKIFIQVVCVSLRTSTLYLFKIKLIFSHASSSVETSLNSCTLFNKIYNIIYYSRTLNIKQLWFSETIISYCIKIQTYASFGALVKSKNLTDLKHHKYDT